MRMQVGFRTTNKKRAGQSVVIACGVLEVSSAQAEAFDEKQVSFKFHFHPSSAVPLVVHCLANAHDFGDSEYQPDYVRDNVCDMALEDTITQTFEREMPTEWRNAELAVRRTEVRPTSPDRVVLAFAGLVHVPEFQIFNSKELLSFASDEMTGDTLMRLEGTVGADLRRELGTLDMEQIMRGEGLSQMLKLPLWGWDEEPVALPGTLRVEHYHKAERLNDLYFSERSPEMEAELQMLERQLRPLCLGRVTKEGEIYADVVRRVRQEPGYKSLYQPRTRSEDDQQSAIMKKVMADIMDERGIDYLRGH